MTSLKGKTAVVTGGGRGLGFCISKSLASEGANIAVVYPQFEEAPKNAIETLLNCGVKAKAYAADVTKSEDVSKAFAAIIREFLRIDILINNAGRMSEFRLNDLREEEWDQVINTDLKSVFLCSKAVAAEMKKQRGGAIVNVASQMAYKGGVGLSHYAAAKAGVIAFTKSIALELVEYGIRVNAVAPGPIVTDMTLPYMDDEQWVEAKRNASAIRRLALPEEIAPAVLFLVSEDAGMFIGQTLMPNGGGVMI